MEQQANTLVPPPPLRGIGSDYSLMNDKVSMNDTPAAANGSADASPPKTFGPLRGLGGDYGVMNEAIAMCEDMRAPTSKSNPLKI